MHNTKWDRKIQTQNWQRQRVPFTDTQKSSVTYTDVIDTKSEERKRIVTEAAAKASVLDLLPLSLCDSKHHGMRQYVERII